MTQANHHAVRMTTEEAVREVFPPRVIEKAEQVAAQSDARSTQSMDLTALVSRFRSEDKCRAYLEQLRWPDGVRCPRCDATKGISRIETRGQFDCDSCGYQFSVRVGTIFYDSRLPLWKWFLAIYAMGESKKRISGHQLERLLGVSYKTAWYLRQRIRPAMEDGAIEPLVATVES